MWRPAWIKPVRRERLAMLVGLVTFVGLGSALFVSKGTQVLMPGPLSSAHGSIETCNACHSQNGSGKLSWLHGLVAGDRRADSKACLTCHKMPDTAFNAHGASADVLEHSTKRLMEVAAQTPAPRSARAQDAAFPAHDAVARGLSCATCHQEHQGVGFKLNKISNEQCRSCHVVKFDSFDRHHPNFENYPFKRRTRIVYDHAGHFGKHYPELAKKEPAKRIPDTCASCHNSRDDKRVMAVAPFEKTCSGCHLNQITGKERASGPKGIAFLALPGLDVPTLKAKNAAIGEWPDASDAALTPFMKVMISRNERGRALVKTVDGLNLQDLAHASDDQIKAVTDLVWEIKGLFHALIKGKASDVLGDLNIGGGAKLSANLVADLTASIPRDVVLSAQQEWLPNLAAEMTDRPGAGQLEKSGRNTDAGGAQSTGSAASEKPTGSDARQPAPTPRGDGAGSKGKPEGAGAKPSNAKPEGGKEARSAKELPAPMRAGVGDPATTAQSDADTKADDGAEAPSVDEHGGTARGRQPLPDGTPREIEARRKKKAQPEEAEEKRGAAKTEVDGGKDAPAKDQPRANQGGAGTAAAPEAAAGKADPANATPDGGKEAASGDKQAPDKVTDQSDELLFPTEEEQREMKAARPADGKAGRPDEAAGKADPAGVKPDGGASSNEAVKADADAPAGSGAGSSGAAPVPQARPAPVISIGSDVDPESWAEYGGWYRQDYAIFYRPTGHKDKFIYSWLFLTGPQAPKGDKSPAAAVFNVLTSKDAQGSCTKCHSIDDLPGRGRLVNFTPASPASKQGQFTTFIHEPHFGVMEDRGCLTCHKLEKEPARSPPAADGAAAETSPYLKSYEQGNSQTFAANFGEVKKGLCKTCHTSGMARQDCLLCHKYHVNGVATPIIDTKLPIQ